MSIHSVSPDIVAATTYFSDESPEMSRMDLPGLIGHLLAKPAKI